MTSIRPTPSPKLPPELLIGLMIALAVMGIPSIVQHFLDQQRYESAMQSYKKADCGKASEQFNQIIDTIRLIDIGKYVPRAKEKKAECKFFQDASRDQEEGKFESALLNYSKLAVYDDSALLEPTRKRLHDLFQNLKIETLATSSSCTRLGTLTENNLLPKSNTNLPSLYLACGKVFEADKTYKRAIFIYEKFLQEYSDHTLALDVRRALARTTVADIKGRRGVRNIKSPGRTGTTADGSTVIEIHNTSPGKMEITFSGATPKFEELKTCRDCVMYDKPPDLCPSNGTVGRYRLEPGQYDIAVKFKADNGNTVNPWAGNWNLEAGAEYKTCFFIIRNPLNDPQKKNYQ